jgi:two-component system chemotaxis response regulator CheY
MKKILIVDDSAMLRDMLTYSLNSGGFEDITSATDGLEALEIAQLREFDLVITDINMPNMNGFELIKALRELKNYKKTPLIVLTTEKSEEMKKNGKNAGATGWIIKPFEPEKLLKVVKLILNRDH